MALSILSGTRGTVTVTVNMELVTTNVSKVGFAVNVAGLFGVMSVFGRRVKEMVRLQLE